MSTSGEISFNVLALQNVRIYSEWSEPKEPQEEPTSTNTSTKTLCSKCQRSFKLLCGLSQHEQKFKDDEPTDSIIKSTLDVNKELSNNTEFWGNHSIDDLKQTISVIMKRWLKGK